MPFINVYNANDYTETLVKSIIDFTIANRRVYDTDYYIDVEMCDTEEMDGAMGWTHKADRRDISIQIRNDLSIDQEQYFKTIIHETVHATQLMVGMPMCETEAYAEEERIYKLLVG